MSPSRPARGHHPGTLPLADALSASDTLARLLDGARASRQRFEIVAPMLPPALRAVVRAGPVDDTAWVLLADHGAAAAKLRQLLPALQQALADRGLAAPPVKVRVLPRQLP